MAEKDEYGLTPAHKVDWRYCAAQSYPRSASVADALVIVLAQLMEARSMLFTDNTPSIAHWRKAAEEWLRK